MGKQPRLYGRAYAESLGCDKSDTSQQVGLHHQNHDNSCLNTASIATIFSADPDQAASTSCEQTPVQLQRGRQLGRHGQNLFFMRPLTCNQVYHDERYLKVPSPWKPLVDTWSSNPFLPKNPRCHHFPHGHSRAVSHKSS